MRQSNRWIMHGLGDVAKWSIVEEPDEDVAEGCAVEEHPRGVGLASFVVAGGDVVVERLLTGHREGSDGLVMNATVGARASVHVIAPL